MRILVVEDEKKLNELISSKLKLEHYSVDSCYDGTDAWIICGARSMTQWCWTSCCPA